MTHNELMDRLLFLKPTAKFSVWTIGPGETYMGETEPKDRFGYLVDWRGPGLCPSETTITNVAQEDIDALKETTRKSVRDSRMANDLSLVANFDNARLRVPELTFSGYLDYLETMGESL